MAFRLGIITLDTENMLNLFRRLRNDFAHDFTIDSFEAQGVRDRLTNVFNQQPDIYKSLLEEAREHAEHILAEHDLKLDPSEFVRDHWPLRASFDLFFAATAAALASLKPDICRIPSQVGNPSP